MTLGQEDINKSALMAAVIIKEKSNEELQVLALHLRTIEMRDDFAAQFKAQLTGMLQVAISDLSSEFVRDLTERIHRGVLHKLNPTEGAT